MLKLPVGPVMGRVGAWTGQDVGGGLIVCPLLIPQSGRMSSRLVIVAFWGSGAPLQPWVLEPQREKPPEQVSWDEVPENRGVRPAQRRGLGSLDPMTLTRAPPPVLCVHGAQYSRPGNALWSKEGFRESPPSLQRHRVILQGPCVLFGRVQTPGLGEQRFTLALCEGHRQEGQSVRLSVWGSALSRVTPCPWGNREHQVAVLSGSAQLTSVCSWTTSTVFCTWFLSASRMPTRAC